MYLMGRRPLIEKSGTGNMCGKLEGEICFLFLLACTVFLLHHDLHGTIRNQLGVECE